MSWLQTLHKTPSNALAHLTNSYQKHAC